MIKLIVVYMKRMRVSEKIAEKGEVSVDKRTGGFDRDNGEEMELGGDEELKLRPSTMARLV